MHRRQRTPLTLAEEAARRALAMSTVEEVRAYLTEKAREVWPDVGLVDLRR